MPEDSLQPCQLSLQLGPGTTTDVPATLHFAKLPPKADILLAFDTTGSMGAAITDAKNDADALVTQIQSEIPNARFAVADFRDYTPLRSTTSAARATTRGAWSSDFTDNSGTVDCSAGGETAP